MRDAIGGSLLLYLVIFFVSIVMLFFVSALSYVKAYRVKNRIINIVEKHDFAERFNEEDKKNLISEINSDLTHIGYTASKKVTGDKCKNNSNYGSSECQNINTKANGRAYDYCLCKINSNNGYFFEVITFSQFKLPVIGSLLSSSVHGETKLLGQKFEY